MLATHLIPIADKQLAYTLSGNASSEGSQAIALGRSAALAKMIGLDAVANHFWNELENLPCTGHPTVRPSALPTLDAFYEGYKNHTSNFALFSDSTNFSALGTDFSNAAGSYAYALDYHRRGKEALAGGEPAAIAQWGATALKAAGFPEQAQALPRMLPRNPLSDVSIS